MFNTKNSNLRLNINGKPKLILIASAALLGFALIIIVYYILNGSKTQKTQVVSNADVEIPLTDDYTLSDDVSTKSVAGTEMPLDNKEVFNIKRNIYALNDAEAACKVFDAKVATIDQLINSHKKGADWCNVGWTKDGIAAFPVQKETWLKTQDNEGSKRNECGPKDGINVVRSDPYLLYGVNCYGNKPEPRGMEKIKTKYLSDKEKEMLLKYNEFKSQEKQMTILPFNEESWSNN